MKKFVVVPIIIGDLRTVIKNLEKSIEQIGAAISVENLWNAGLLGTDRILRKLIEKYGLLP